MQQGEHEIISDDGLMQLYFTQVDASNELLPAHWHEHLEMICMQHGAMTAYINETSYELQQGDILVVNPRDIHYTHVSHGLYSPLYSMLERSQPSPEKRLNTITAVSV